MSFLTSEPQVILVTPKDQPIGQCGKLRAHQEALLHRAFSVMILCEHQGETLCLLHQRAEIKYHCGGLWTNACCSHPAPEQDTTEAAVTRLQFEMGLDCDKLQDIGSICYQLDVPPDLVEHELDHVLIGYVNHQTPAFNPDEVQAVSWKSLDTIQTELAEQPGNYTPWFPKVFEFTQAYLSPLTPGE